MNSFIGIHETAFVTSSFRSMAEELSRDPYARLWNNPKTDAWIEGYLQQVSSEDLYCHCLRNRYFLETMKALHGKNQLSVLINFGSGFSMYPFLLPEDVAHIELDRPEILEYKQAQLARWQEEDKLPRRKIHFIPADFTAPDNQALLSNLIEIKQGRPSYILLEGVLFFLDPASICRLFHLFADIQQTGGYVSCCTYWHDIQETHVYPRLLSFFHQQVDRPVENPYQTLSHTFFESLTNYTLIDHQDYFSQSALYGHQPGVGVEEVLNEHAYLLRRR